MYIKSNKIIIFSAPSGAGKTTIAKEILKRITSLEFSVSACSREMRAGEKEGVDYYFLSVDEFKKKIELDEFLEWQEVYPGSFYGTLKSEVERIWSKGKNVIFDVDTFGGLNIKKMYGNKALALFIKTDTFETLEKRLKARGTENVESMNKRMTKAKLELAHSNEFDRIIINENLEKAINEVYNIIYNFLNTN
ncbi:MAG: guanylate kinase [Bacteroidales bacterium]|nr:guanylate kinase [Bacteroidales bacterium]